MVNVITFFFFHRKLYFTSQKSYIGYSRLSLGCKSPARRKLFFNVKKKKSENNENVSDVLSSWWLILFRFWVCLVCFFFISDIFSVGYWRQIPKYVGSSYCIPHLCFFSFILSAIFWCKFLLISYNLAALKQKWKFLLIFK